MRKLPPITDEPGRTISTCFFSGSIESTVFIAQRIIFLFHLDRTNTPLGFPAQQVPHTFHLTRKADLIQNYFRSCNIPGPHCHRLHPAWQFPDHLDMEKRRLKIHLRQHRAMISHYKPDPNHRNPNLHTSGSQPQTIPRLKHSRYQELFRTLWSCSLAREKVNPCCPRGSQYPM